MPVHQAALQVHVVGPENREDIPDPGPDSIPVLGHGRGPGRHRGGPRRGPMKRVKPEQPPAAE